MLQEIAADRGAIAQLRRGAFEERFGDQRLYADLIRMRGDLGHAGQRADHEIAAFRTDMAERQPVDVDEPLRRFDLLAHQVYERSAGRPPEAAAASVSLRTS